MSCALVVMVSVLCKQGDCVLEHGVGAVRSMLINLGLVSITPGVAGLAQMVDRSGF